MALPELGERQEDAVRAVCALFLTETRWVSGASPDFPPAAREEILRRREACQALLASDPARGPNGTGVACQVREWNERVSASQEISRTGELVKGEVDELLEACASGDIAAIAHEGCDVVWTALDTLIAHGIDFQTAFAEVLRANWSRIGPTGEILRRENGAIGKGPWYTRPDPARLLGLAA